MSGLAAARRRSLLANALAHVEDWLVESGDAPCTADSPPPPDAVPIVTVVALAPRCGGTTVARGLAAVLASRSTLGAALVSGATGSVAPALSTPGATRLGRSVDDWSDAPNRVSGRLCLIDGDARQARAAALRTRCALVIDVPYGVDASEPSALADQVVVVAAPATSPALAAVVGASLTRSGPSPLIVVNRADGDDAWAGRADHELPDTRVASRIAMAGREPPGALGAALGELADRCSEAAR
jgi:hypothetical protein